MSQDTVNTMQFVELVIRTLEDVIIPAAVVWIVYLIRKWLKGELDVPAYKHEVKLAEPEPASATRGR